MVNKLQHRIKFKSNQSASTPAPYNLYNKGIQHGLKQKQNGHPKQSREIAEQLFKLNHNQYFKMFYFSTILLTGNTPSSKNHF